MRAAPVITAAFVVSATAALAAQQEPVFSAARRAFSGLFTPANRACAGCEDRPGTSHFVIDSPRITGEFLARHVYQSNAGQHGDNTVVADLWYDAVHRRLFTRSLVLHEVDDPADLRLGRAPGTYPNTPDFDAVLPPGTTVGHVGFERWASNGYGAYFAALQGAVGEAHTGFLDLATVTGSSGRTRSGSTYGPEDLIKHVRLHPSGLLEVGFDTDPAARPETSLVVRGRAHVEGDLVVDGAVQGGGMLRACSMRSSTGARGRAAAAACDGEAFAIGGGGTCASGELRGSRPTQAGGEPDGWEVTCSRDGTHAVYVICCAR
jgi:hypothetical protein